MCSAKMGAETDASYHNGTRKITDEQFDPTTSNCNKWINKTK